MSLTTLASAIVTRLRQQSALNGLYIAAEVPGDPAQRLTFITHAAQGLALLVESPRVSILDEAGQERIVIPIRITESALSPSPRNTNGEISELVRATLNGWTPPGFSYALAYDPDQPHLVLFKDRLRSRNTEILFFTTTR